MSVGRVNDLVCMDGAAWGGGGEETLGAVDGEDSGVGLEVDAP